MTEFDDEFGFPVCCVVARDPVPDLARVPRGRWRELLTPINRFAREAALWRFRLELGQDELDQWFEAFKVIGEIADEAGQHRRRLRRAAEAMPAGAPAPVARPSPTRDRQVNVRLYERDFGRLERAAALLGATPTELARTFVVRGTTRVLEEDETRRSPKP